MKTSTNDETTCTAGDRDTNSSSASSSSTTASSFGILKRSSDDKISKKKHSAASGKKSAKIVWDEQNLAENEQIQQAIIEHCKKTNKRIDEPKTPYVSYVLPDDEVARNENSENGAKSHTTTMSPVHTDDHDVSWMEDVEASEARKVLPREVDSKIISPTEQMSRLQLAFAAANTTNESSHDEARPRRLIDDWESPSSPEPEPEMITVGMDEVSSNQNESEEFARKRKQHYNEFLMVKQMRERMKASLDDEDEDEE